MHLQVCLKWARQGLNWQDTEEEDLQLVLMSCKVQSLALVMIQQEPMIDGERLTSKKKVIGHRDNSCLSLED